MKAGDVIVFKDGAGPGLPGKRGAILRRSKRTGTLTVQLIEAAGAYKKGDTVHVAPYEVAPWMEVR